jgi:RNA-directed DNA polymerase
LLLSRENLLSALHRVEANKGSHGVDGMSVKELQVSQNWSISNHEKVFHILNITSM